MLKDREKKDYDSYKVVKKEDPKTIKYKKIKDWIKYWLILTKINTGDLKVSTSTRNGSIITGDLFSKVTRLDYKRRREWGRRR